MAVESSVSPLLNDQKQQLAQELSNAAQSLNRAAVAAERLARFVSDVDFDASPSEQQSQFMAVLSATKDLQNTFSLSEASSKKRRRTEKDPNAPKRPITSYLIFQEARRKELATKHPELPYRDVLKLLGVEWKNMSDADKQPYVLAHEKALAQHDVDMAAYAMGKGVPTTDKSVPPKPEKAGKSVKTKDQKPAAKAKAAAAAIALPLKAPVMHVPHTPSESSDEESDSDSSGEDESDSEVPPPPKKSKVEAKTPSRFPKKEAKKEKK